VRLYESAFTDQRNETKGLLGSAVIFGHAVKEDVLFLAARQGRILNLAKHMGKTKVPYSLLAILAITVSVIGMFSLRPEYGRELGVFFGLQQNQFFSVIVGFLLILMLFIVMRRRRQQNA